MCCRIYNLSLHDDHAPASVFTNSLVRGHFSGDYFYKNQRDYYQQNRGKTLKVYVPDEIYQRVKNIACANEISVGKVLEDMLIWACDFYEEMDDLEKKCQK